MTDEIRKHWWETHPWRMVQTNLRAVDMRDISAAEYVASLKDMHASVVMINAGGILASYDSALEFQPDNPYLEGDSLAEIIDACHRAGIRVIARTDFSRITREVFEKHPEWAYRDADGNTVDCNGTVSTCPNSDYHESYKFEIVRELFTRFPFDGIFYNMSGSFTTDYTGKYYGPCQCPVCKEKYRAAFGKEMPSVFDPADPVFRSVMALNEKTVAAQKERLYRMIKEIDPEIAVCGHDYIRTESNSDIGRPAWLYSAASINRSVRGRDNKVRCDNACTDFIGFRYRDSSVPAPLMEIRQWQNLSYGGAASLYIMGTLTNHRDVTCFASARDAFRFHQEHEELFGTLRSAARTAILRSGNARMASAEERGWIRLLTESHVPFCELLTSGLSDPRLLDGLDCVILPGTVLRTPAMKEAVDAFAENGGTVLYSGSSPDPGLRCLGIAEVEGRKKDLMSTIAMIREQDACLFPRSSASPYVPFGTEMACITVKDGVAGYGTIVPEHPFGPPEYCVITDEGTRPAVTVSAYGRGTGICLPYSIGAFYEENGFTNTRSFVQDVLYSLAKTESAGPDLPAGVELAFSRTDSGMLIQLINETGCLQNGYDAPLPVFGLTILPPCGFTQATCLNGGSVTLLEKDGAPQLCLDRLDHYEAILLT